MIATVTFLLVNNFTDNEDDDRWNDLEDEVQTRRTKFKYVIQMQ